MTVQLSRARRLAKRQIKVALSTYFNTEVTAALAQSEYLQPPPLPGITDASAIKLTDPDQPDKLPRNSEVFIYVFEDSDRNITRTNSGGVSGQKKDTEQDYKIIVVFKFAIGDGVQDADGNRPDTDEQMRHRADLYLEALVECIYKHVGTSAEVGDIELIADSTFPIYQDQFPIVGICATTWRATQITLVPNPVC